MVLSVGLVGVFGLLGFMAQQLAWVVQRIELSAHRSRDSVVGRAEQHRSPTAQQRRAKIRTALLLQVCAMAAAHLVQNEVTPPKQCEFRGLENLKMHDIKGRRPLENRVF